MSAPRSPAPDNRWDMGFGLVVIALCAIALAFWIPGDTGSGFLEKSITGLSQPGDAFFPDILVGTMLVLGVLQCVTSWLRIRRGEDGRIGRIGKGDIVFSICTAIGLGMVIAVMSVAGPAVVAILDAIGWTDSTYRALVDTVPYKYVGFVIGGIGLVFGVSSLLEGRGSRRGLVTAILLVIVLILIFDVLLTNIFLPPNLDY